MAERIAIVDGLRTPFCKMGSNFKDMSAQELAATVVRELLQRSGVDPKLIDEVIFGNVGQPADAANISRVIALLSGLPFTTPAFTVNRNCASGIEAVVTAAFKIKSCESKFILTGGTESMSNYPFLLTKELQDILSELNRAKDVGSKLKTIIKLRPGYFSPRIGLQMGLTDPACGLNMGQTAEVLAKEFGISRQEQDEFALLSHQRAFSSRALLKEEIMPIIPASKYKAVVEHDNGVRENQTSEALAKLNPIFDKYSGSVTAGNSSQVTDGAVVLLVMSESRAKELNLKPLGFLKSFAFVGVEPARMGMGPAHAIPQALKKAGMTLKDIAAIEINEAFAVQVLACLRALESEKFASDFGYGGLLNKIDPSILNVNGGAIALGHPVGATGCRLILTMLKHMNRNNLATGLVSLCIGGGQGAAVILER